MMIAGGSGCGKSTLVSKIIANINQVMDRVPARIVVCYSRMQHLYDTFKKLAPCPIEFIEGLPADLVTPPNTLLILDDLQGRENVRAISSWFTKNSHHYDTSVLYLIQNIFDKFPEHRTISLNAHYIIVFKNPRDASQISHLARQMYPTNPNVMISAYKQATAEAHGYLLVDLKQNTSDIWRLRQGLFPAEGIFAFVDQDTVGQKQDLPWYHA